MTKVSVLSILISFWYNIVGQVHFQKVGIEQKLMKYIKMIFGVTFTNDFNVWQISSYSDLSRVYMVTFEYDWYASKKVIFFGGGVFGKIARMKHDNEWYQKFNFELENGTTVTESTKGEIIIKM